MRGSIQQRYKGTWSLIFNLGYRTDEKTGLKKRKQKWLTFKGTKRQAEAELAKRLTDVNRHEFVEPTTRTLGEWLDAWLEKSIKPPAKRIATYEGYKAIIKNHLAPALGDIPLQQLDASDLERYYVDRRETLSQCTLQQHHMILSGALRAAMRGQHVSRNVATLVEGKPKADPSAKGIRANCWEASEAQRFLDTAKGAGAQSSALFALALDSGMRKGELCGLRWSDVNLDKGKVTVSQQQVKGGRAPVFGPTKNGEERTIDLGAEALARLKAHKGAQAALKLRNGPHYHDHGLVFAKEWGDLQRGHDTLGQPLEKGVLGQRLFDKLIAKAEVRPITFHGLRHTCASLLLGAGVPVHVVAQRLGHRKVQTTWEIYAHALPSMQADAAVKLNAVLHG